MSEQRPWSTKSAAHRFGFVPCPSCNPAGKPSGEVTTPCAWCWSNDDKIHRRFVLNERAREWARAHGLDEDDIPTSPESRDALLHPPKLDVIPDTLPAPDRECGYIEFRCRTCKLKSTSSEIFLDQARTYDGGSHCGLPREFVAWHATSPSTETEKRKHDDGSDRDR